VGTWRHVVDKKRALNLIDREAGERQAGGKREQICLGFRTRIDLDYYILKFLACIFPAVCSHTAMCIRFVYVYRKK
jgi:hypothetical protein